MTGGKLVSALAGAFALGVGVAVVLFVIPTETRTTHPNPPDVIGTFGPTAPGDWCAELPGPPAIRMVMRVAEQGAGCLAAVSRERVDTFRVRRFRISADNETEIDLVSLTGEDDVKMWGWARPAQREVHVVSVNPRPAGWPERFVLRRRDLLYGEAEDRLLAALSACGARPEAGGR